MGIKLGVGRFYRTRGGEVAYTTRLRLSQGYPVTGAVFRFADDYTGGPAVSVWSWTFGGRFNASYSVHAMDLVEELSPDHELVLVALATLALTDTTLEEYTREH